MRYLPRRPDAERRTLDLRTDAFGLAHGASTGTDVGPDVQPAARCPDAPLRGSVDRFADPGFIDYDYLLIEPGVSEPEPDLSDPQAVAANLRRQPDANPEETVSGRLSLLWNASPRLSTLATVVVVTRPAARRGSGRWRKRVSAYEGP